MFIRKKRIKRALSGAILSGACIMGCSVVQAVIPANITFAQESENPKVISITTDKSTVSPGDTVKVSAELTDGTNVSGLAMTMISEDSGFPGRVVNLYKQTDNTFSGEFTIDDRWPNVGSRVTNVYVYDTSGDLSRYYTFFDNKDELNDVNTDVRDIKYNGFTVTGSKGDYEGPVINDISFDKTDVSPGDKLKITVNVTDQSIIELRSVDISFIYHKKTGEEYDFANVAVGKWSAPDKDGNISADIIVDDTFKNGIYDIYMAGATDVLGNLRDIGGSQELTKLFDGFSVSGSKEISKETLPEDDTSPNENNEHASDNDPKEEMPDDKYTGIYPYYYGDYLNKYHDYSGQPFIVEDEEGNNISNKTKIELYKIVDGKEVKSENFATAEYLINYFPQGEAFYERYISGFDHYKLIYESNYEDISGDYVLKCVNVPDGYEKFDDIKFSISMNNNENFMKNVIKMSDKNGTSVRIPDNNPGYINEKGWNLIVNPENTSELKIVETDKAKLGKTADENTIADIYDLFTIVLNKKQTKVAKSGTSVSGSGEKQVASAVKTSEANVTKAAPTGDDNLLGAWIIAGAVSTVTAGIVITVRRRYGS